MPDRRQNRGAHPEDRACFAPGAFEKLRRAGEELSWLLSRGYSVKAATTLVGDRHALRSRQRAALQRVAASDQAVAFRRARRADPEEVRGATVWIDGYNVLLTVESALSDAVLLRGRDGSLRDLAAMSRHFKRVQQTRPALEHIGGWLDERGCGAAVWYLDRPISNSGRLAGLITDVGHEAAWPWQVELVPSADPVLVRAPRGVLVASADAGILDRGVRSLDLAWRVVDERVGARWLLDFDTEQEPGRAPAPATGQPTVKPVKG